MMKDKYFIFEGDDMRKEMDCTFTEALEFFIAYPQYVGDDLRLETVESGLAKRDDSGFMFALGVEVTHET
ncbi:MAG: hypothetical protein V3T96_04360 [Thermodesulfobacteriota bacterium]